MLMENASLYEFGKSRVPLCLNIRNEPGFIARSVSVPKARFWVYKFVDVLGQYAGILSVMNDESREVMEMLNSDSAQTAAERAGIKSTSVADIFQQMLGKEYKAYLRSQSILNFIAAETARPLLPLPPPPTAGDDPATAIHRRTYTRADLLQQLHIRYEYPGIRDLLDEAKKEFGAISEKASLAIQRVKDNLKEGTCPICCNDLGSATDAGASDDIIIFKCCGIIMCNVCTFGMVFYSGNQVSMQAVCTKCRRPITIKDVIYVTSNFDLDKLLQNQLDYDSETPVLAADPGAPDAKSDMPPKIDMLYRIVTGAAVGREISPPSKQLMCGTVVIDAPEAAPRKVLVFSNYDECLSQINANLGGKVKIYTLMGTHETIRNRIEMFKNETQHALLLINSIRYCSGLNLHFASDVVFMHRIQNHDIEEQVLGRGQRIGREFSLRVHYLLYSNEAGPY